MAATKKDLEWEKKQDNQRTSLWRNMMAIDFTPTRHEVTLTGVKMRMPRFEGDDVFFIVSGREPDGRDVVAMVRADTIQRGYVKVFSMFISDKLDWRDDAYGSRGKISTSE